MIEFPRGLIGLGGSRYALLAAADEAPFAWLHSVDDPTLALPVANPWCFFADYAVELSDAEAERITCRPGRREVWSPSAPAPSSRTSSRNLRAPILVAEAGATR